MRVSTTIAEGILRRAPRLVEFHARDKANPSLEEVFDGC